ncbi:hypothetical protein EYC84_010733 [Monilinia fructicola]|uniref:SP-RING-type domain-containing protein n=1 Tax=Monilinia fructicola TaxID=38448 RepID=A0A5M9J663_MONFR|nr:hypothetical protein EYC84_010733 [Monilinia fructicola]
MRRPPDKDGLAITERDVVSSNATLNAFFGGSRQKSWMLAGGAPVRPTPRRPSINKPSDHRNTNIQRRPTVNLLSPVASNESSSPALAHNSTPLDNTHTAAVSGTHGSPVVNATVANSQTFPQAYNTPSNTDVVLRHASPDASRGEVGESHTVASEEAPRRRTPASIVSTQNPTQELSSRHPPNQNIDNQVSPVTPGDLEILTMMLGNVDQALSSHAQSSRRRALPPTMPSLKPRIELIKSYIEHCGGMANLNSALEKPRFSLMEIACKSEDAFYVALHQLFCVWDTSREDIAAIPGLPDSTTLSHAFRILGQLIRDNEGLAPSHLRWFAKFPSPLLDLVTTSEPYRRVIQEVGAFLSKLASDWSNLTRLCANRGHPPLVDELISRLGLLSSTLQNIVFTASRRNLNIVDDEFGNQMERVFEEDKTGHKELAARFNTACPPSDREIQERTQTIVKKYMMISQKSRQKKNATLAPQPSSTAPVPPSRISPAGQVPVAANGSYAYSNRSVSNPTQSVIRQQNDVPNRQIVQNLGQIRTSFSGPPSGTFSNHSNSAPSTAADSSTSIHMQGLSMGSPTQQGFQYSSPVLQSTGNQFPSPVMRNNGTQSPIIAQNQGLPQDQYHHDPRFGPRQQTYHPHQLLQQQFGQQGQYGTNNHLQMSLQQNQQNQQNQMTQQQQQQQWVQHAMPSGPQHSNQHQIPQQQQVSAIQAMQRRPHLRREGNPVNGQQQQPQVLSRNGSRNGSRNNSVSSDNMRASMNGPVVYPQSFPQGTQGFPGSRPVISIEEQQCMHYRMSDPMKRPIIPPLGFAHPQGLPDPDSNALQQAHVRSPRLVTVDVSKLGSDDVSRRFYQFVKVLDPLRFTAAYLSQSIDWHRSFTTAPNTEAFSISSWVVSDTVWPDMVFMAINSDDHCQNVLEVRRKLHHGKDLPIDLTTYVWAGKNEITVSMPKMTTEIKKKEYFIAVEEIEILQHHEIIDLCKEQSIPAAKVLEEIKKKLAGPTEDDDLIIVASDLSIDLTDPFTARIFEIPVRGKDCLHRECFDLETFLSTRGSKQNRTGQPSLVDVWKCPLCSLDARPYNLRCDQFLVSVREELQKQNNLDVKAILVAADGTWRPKPDSQSSHKRKSTTGEDDGDSIDGGRPSKKSTGGSKAVVVEIIDLDDD